LTAGKDARGDALRLPAKEVVETLRDPGAVRFLVQPTLRLRDPAAFARRFGLDPDALEIAPASPDLVRIRRGRGGRLRFEVIDIKWSRERAVHHFAQIAFYVLLLEEIVRDEGIDGTVETRWGWIWRRGGGGPKRFPLAAYLHHVEQFLSGDLPRVLAAEPAAAEWHLGPRCAGCAFFQLCRAEADAADDLARVPGVTPLARRVLRGRGHRTVADLQKAGYRRETYTGCHALESAETSLKQRAQALRFNKLFEVESHTHLLSETESVRVTVSAEADPVSGVVFALGLRVDGGGRGREDVFLAEKGTAEAEGEMLRAFLARLAERVMAAAADAEPGEGRIGRSLHFYLWDRAELATIRELLQRHVGDPAAQPAIARLQRLLFRPGDRGRLAPAPGTVLHDAVAELFALPVPYAWDLPSVSAALKPSEHPAVHRPRDDYGWPFSSQVAFERIHNVWRRRPHRTRAGAESPDQVAEEIRATVRSKLAALDSVLRAVREQVARGRKPKLRLEPAGAPSSIEAEPIPDARLETLRIFTEMEAAEEAVAIRALHTLPARDRARRFECVRGMEFAGETERGHLVFEFDPDCREVKFRPGDFALVLTNDDGQTLLETDRKPWLRRQLMVELVDFDLAASPPRVVLAPGSAFKDAVEKGTISLRHQCVLDRSDADFNTKRVV
ncbi:MAG TPA: hypothetical protein VFQ39_17285, partial [Longimicrobium sp.]|nr:hypothetical protein [Longimicrobium sp.]